MLWPICPKICMIIIVSLLLMRQWAISSGRSGSPAFFLTLCSIRSFGRSRGGLVMQLVMKRSRLYSGIWFRFKINARLVLEETEKPLLVKYALKDVPLTDGRTRRDLVRAALIIIPIAVIFAVVIAFIVAVLRVIAFGLSIVVFISILVVIYIYTFMQIREVVFVNDLLVGRDFKARSL